MSALLEAIDLVGGYGPVRVLHGLSFDVQPGEVVVILGANGAGKTTTLRALSGLLDDVKGSVKIEGEDVLGLRPDQIVRLGVAHVPQGRGTITDLTVEENLRLGAYVRRDADVQQDIEHWYSVFPRLGERREQPAGSMSGGEQQMLAIARALMSKPKLVLLDEPSLGLAPLVTRELFTRLGEINRTTGTAMLVVEQNANLALELAHRGYVLETGQIVAGGSASELKSDETVRKAYLGY
ncbi:MAG: ABC transporter ATP-binding protein [Acidimicrobiales bacterium]|nr:ABC transporter ATP-binding protein [Acidimicrobiales bacterium]